MGLWTPGPAATAGDDTYTGDTTDETIDGLAGDDHISGLGGNDYLVGGAGQDRLEGGAGHDTLHGDTVLFTTDTGGPYNDYLDGGDGDDVLAGGYGDDVLIAGDGDDLLFTGRADYTAPYRGGVAGTTAGGHDTLDGGAGNDRATFALGDEVGDIIFSLADPTVVYGYRVDGLVAGTITNVESVSFNGGRGDDQLTGGALDDYLVGGDGADVLSGGGGSDDLDGGDGDDVLGGGDGDDRFHGSAGYDQFIGGDGVDSVNFGGQTVGITIDMGSTAVQTTAIGTFTLDGIENLEFGTRGNDHIIGGDIGRSLNGYEGDDLIEGGAGADTLKGGLGADTLIGAGGSDTLWIDAGDTASGGGGDDVYVADDLASLAGIVELAGEGRDTVVARPGSVAPYSAISIENVANVERVTLDSSIALDVTGNSLDNEIIGDGFDNTLRGLDGADRLDGGEGTDTLYGGNGADELIGAGGNDTLNGEAGDDILAGGYGTNILAGGDGMDTASYATGFRVTVSLALTGAQQTNYGLDTLSGIENLTGSATDDRLTGDDGANVLSGGDGADTLEGGGGNDTLNGDGGDDLLDGGDGDDALNGGAGNDTATYASATVTNGVSVSLSTPAPQSDSTVVADTFTSVENLIGSAYNDVLKGDAGVNVLSGSGGHDSLFGEEGNDTLRGDAGQDNLMGGMGDDLLDGGADADFANYSDIGYFTPGNGLGVTVTLGVAGAQDTLGAGVDTLVSIEYLTGSQYADTLTGDANANVLYGQDGDDVIRGGDGADQIFGQSGDDLIEGGAGQDLIDGGSGSDTLSYANHANGIGISLAAQGWVSTGGGVSDYISGFENLTGSAFGDTLTGDDGDNVLNGLAGRDFLVGGVGNDTLIGGDGMDDALYLSASSAVTVSLAITGAQDTGGAGLDTLSGIENLMGSQYNDVLTGDGGDNVLRGQDGDDILDGGAGNDVLVGGLGIDTATYRSALAGVVIDLGVTGIQDTGGSGNDAITSVENLTGTDFNDQISGNASDNGLDGGLGIDTVSYAAASAGVTVSLALTTAQDTAGAGTDTLAGFENLTGSAFADTLTGDAGSNVISGMGGDDLIVGGLGDDVLDGGEGNDTASYAGATAAVLVNLSYNGNTLGAGNDTLTSIENLIGSAFNDVLTGDDGDNILRGEAGNDHLIGGAGDDTLIGGDGTIDRAEYIFATGAVTVNLNLTDRQSVGGGQGADLLSGIEDVAGGEYADSLTGDAQNNNLFGHGGDDVIEGGVGNDYINGGAGSDTASYRSAAAAVSIDMADSAMGMHDTKGAGVDTFFDVENLTGSAFDDTLRGDFADNVLDGWLGSDTLVGAGGDDILRDGGETANRDFLYGGVGNDTYYVISSLTGPTDLVYEGSAVAGAEGGAGDVDVIHSGGEFFWDYYGVAEALYVDRTEGTQLVGGTNDQSFFGNTGTDVMLVYGGSNRVDAGEGTDVIGLNLYGLDESADGANTVVMKAGSGIDYVYDFESGVDKIDLTSFHFGITGQQVLDQAVNVDLAGTADDHVYFYLTGAGGVDNYIVFMGLQSNQLQASDFITGTV